MAVQPPDRHLQTALAVVGYQWSVHGDEHEAADAFDAIEILRQEAEEFPDEHLPLAELYPHVARLAARSLQALAALGEPGDVDGLRGFEGFEYWRESR